MGGGGGGGGGGGAAGEKMTPYASTMQHSLSSVSDHKKCELRSVTAFRGSAALCVKGQRRGEGRGERGEVEVMTSSGDGYITNTATMLLLQNKTYRSVSGLTGLSVLVAAGLVHVS